jgi:hypothetical protein
LAFSISFIGTSIPCLIVASVLPSFYSTPALISIPLCPNSTFPDPPDAFVGSPLSTACNSSSPPLLHIPLNFSLITGGSVDQHIYIVHNLWAYRFTLSICKSLSCDSSPLTFEVVHNLDGQELGEPDDNLTLDLLPDLLVKNWRVLLLCPNHTLVTEELGIGSDCERFPFFARIEGPLQYRGLGVVNYEAINGGESEGEIWLKIQNLIAIPKDYFVRTPQLYFVSWEQSNLVALFWTGGVFMFLAFSAIVGATIAGALEMS